MNCQHHWLRAAASGLLMASAISAAHAQATDYPDKAVTVISDAGAGSSPDAAMRIVADGLSKVWGKQAVVVNHPGANGSVAARAASEAPNDGYTLYSPALSTFLALPTVAPNLPVKLPRDFQGVGFIADQPMFLAVDPASGITSLAQLIDRAKKAPGTLSIAVSGVGRMTDLTGLLLQQRADIKLVRVPYTGGPSAALADVAAGRVTMIIEGYAGIIGAANAKQINLIAVASAQRLPELPDLPTVAETIPDFAASGWLIVAAPLGTARPIIDKASADIATVVKQPDVQKKLANIGSYTHPMTPEQTEAFVAKQQAIWLPVLQSIPTR
jgi:tripartite-type tricarboxylate transporter receptor subunit TctC